MYSDKNIRELLYAYNKIIENMLKIVDYNKFLFI